MQNLLKTTQYVALKSSYAPRILFNGYPASLTTRR